MRQGSYNMSKYKKEINSMALSEQVEDSMREAESNLRNALSFAARTEKPFIAKHISEMIHLIDELIHADAFFDTIDRDRKCD